MSTPDCHLCREVDGDPDMQRVQVWEDGLWRLTTSIGPGDCTPGFSYLEPKRHIAHITDLDGEEAATFGSVVARCTSALKEATMISKDFEALPDEELRAVADKVAGLLAVRSR
jgi:diadenosine tetraphosphate (Ap4A) HIT family hydrolase